MWLQEPQHKLQAMLKSTLFGLQPWTRKRDVQVFLTWYIYRWIPQLPHFYIYDGIWCLKILINFGRLVAALTVSQVIWFLLLNPKVKLRTMSPCHFFKHKKPRRVSRKTVMIVVKMKQVQIMKLLCGFILRWNLHRIIVVQQFLIWNSLFQSPRARLRPWSKLNQPLVPSFLDQLAWLNSTIHELMLSSIYQLKQKIINLSKENTFLCCCFWYYW